MMTVPEPFGGYDGTSSGTADTFTIENKVGLAMFIYTVYFDYLGIAQVP